MQIYKRIITFLQVEWIWFKLSYTFRFAHHPLCDRYKDQRFQIGNIHLCQGCTLTIAGILTTLVSSLFVVPLLQSYTIMQLMGIAGATILPALIIDGLGASRPWKRFARFLTGSGMGIGIATVVLHSITSTRIIAAFVVSVFWLAYKRYRKLTPAKDLCIGCEYLNEQPCPGFVQQFTANKIYAEQTHELLYGSLEQRIQEIQQQYKNT